MHISDFKISLFRRYAIKAALRRKEDAGAYNFWTGITIRKFPGDAFAIHQMIWRARPQVIVELGTQRGGSAAFVHSFAKACGVEEIISLDIVTVERPTLDGVEYIVGDDTDPKIAEYVAKRVGDRSCSVIIDANHHGDHVLKELNLYGDLVTPGQALILEDTHCDVLNFKKFRETGGPLRAFTQWKNNDKFTLVTDVEPYITTNMFGYWTRNQ